MNNLKQLFQSQPTYFVTNGVAALFFLFSVASILDTTGPIAGSIHVLVGLICIIYIVSSRILGVTAAYVACMILYLPVFILNILMIGDQHGYLIYLSIFLIGSIVTMSTRYAAIVVSVYILTLSTVFSLHGALPFFPETRLSFVAEPVAALFNFRIPDPAISIFHYDYTVPITNWKFANYLIVGVGIYATLLAFRLQLRFARQELHNLLNNILPPSIVDRMNRRLDQDEIIADGHEDVALLIADIVDSTALSSDLTPHEYVYILNTIFAEFDDIVDRYRLEKIKTMGDGYFVAGGAPDFVQDHLVSTMECAIAMRKSLRDLVDSKTVPSIQLRVGIHAGQVVAGVIGKRKFAYDLWGDSVNLASRIESTGVNGEIQVSEHVYSRLLDKYDFVERGYIDMKGKGQIKTYILVDDGG